MLGLLISFWEKKNLRRNCLALKQPKSMKITSLRDIKPELLGLEKLRQDLDAEMQCTYQRKVDFSEKANLQKNQL